MKRSKFLEIRVRQELFACSIEAKFGLGAMITFTLKLDSGNVIAMKTCEWSHADIDSWARLEIERWLIAHGIAQSINEDSFGGEGERSSGALLEISVGDLALIKDDGPDHLWTVSDVRDGIVSLEHDEGDPEVMAHVPVEDIFAVICVSRDGFDEWGEGSPETEDSFQSRVALLAKGERH